MPPVIPSPIVVPTAPQRRLPLGEQILASLLSQAPNIGLGLFQQLSLNDARGAEQAAEKAKQERQAAQDAGAATAGLGVIQALQKEFAGDPVMSAVINAAVGPSIGALGNAQIPSAAAGFGITAAANNANTLASSAVARQQTKAQTALTSENLSFAKETRGLRKQQLELETRFDELRNQSTALNMELAKASDARDAARLGAELQAHRAQVVAAGQSFAANTEALISSQLEQALQLQAAKRGGEDLIPDTVIQDIILTLRQGHTADAIMANFGDYVDGKITREEFNNKVLGDAFLTLGTIVGIDNPDDILTMRDFFETHSPEQTQEWYDQKIAEIDKHYEVGTFGNPNDQEAKAQRDATKLQAFTLLNVWRSTHGQKLLARPPVIEEPAESIWPRILRGLASFARSTPQLPAGAPGALLTALQGASQAGLAGVEFGKSLVGEGEGVNASDLYERVKEDLTKRITPPAVTGAVAGPGFGSLDALLEQLTTLTQRAAGGAGGR